MNQPEQFKPDDPAQLRGEWFCETLDIVENIIRDLERAHKRSPNKAVAEKLNDLRTAEKVLKNLFYAEELMDFSSYQEQMDDHKTVTETMQDFGLLPKESA